MWWELIHWFYWKFRSLSSCKGILKIGCWDWRSYRHRVWRHPFWDTVYVCKRLMEKNYKKKKTIEQSSRYGWQINAQNFVVYGVTFLPHTVYELLVFKCWRQQITLSNWKQAAEQQTAESQTRMWLECATSIIHQAGLPVWYWRTKLPRSHIKRLVVDTGRHATGVITWYNCRVGCRWQQQQQQQQLLPCRSRCRDKGVTTIEFGVIRREMAAPAIRTGY